MPKTSFRLVENVVRLLLCCAALAVTLPGQLQAAQLHPRQDPAVTVWPGETKTIIIPITPRSSDMSAARYLSITASSRPIAARSSHGAGLTATSSCEGVQKALNGAGQTIYQWRTLAQYDFNNTTVEIWGHNGVPSSWWGWSFSHDGWVIAGNKTAKATAASTGYFSHVTLGRQYARVQFTILKDGRCTLSGSTGTW